MIFKIVNNIPDKIETDTVYLCFIDFDDYGYCTTYSVHIKDIQDSFIVKIGCRSLDSKVNPSKSLHGFDSYSINEIIPQEFSKSNPLPDDFFSLGQSIPYYKVINDVFKERSSEYYEVIKDIAFKFERFEALYNSREACLKDSLMRIVHYSDVEQFHRISVGDSELTSYNFEFTYDNDSGKHIEFLVNPDSLPPSNIHVIIGRNGVGKTGLLFQMANCILKNMKMNVDDYSSAKYKINSDFALENRETRFASVVGVSFSVFDDGLSSIRLALIDKVNEQEKLRLQEEFNKRYKYIGLIKSSTGSISQSGENNPVSIKTVSELSTEFENVLNEIASDSYKKSLYLEVCENLEVDEMFRDNCFISGLKDYLKEPDKDIADILQSFKHLSSGHMIIILSLTTLCESIHEKTIVFIDEPETHLHPPLLSTYIRTLSILLRRRNAIGIIATHSPIVLQEVPRFCVTKVERVEGEMTFYRPEVETFAAGMDQLIREIFGHEVIKTGFYKLIEDNLQCNFEKTYAKFDKKIGFLGQIMIQGLLNRSGGDKDEED